MGIACCAQRRVGRIKRVVWYMNFVSEFARKANAQNSCRGKADETFTLIAMEMRFVTSLPLNRQIEHRVPLGLRERGWSGDWSDF